MGPQVTVLLCVYNGRDTVERALDSIVAQTYQRWRLVVVDDGSSDGTGEILRRRSLIEPRMTVVSHPRNLGLAASLNDGWRSTSDPLIARLDADDESLPERLESQVRFLDAHPEVSVLGTAAFLVDLDGSPVGVHTRPSMHEDLARRILSHTPFLHPSVVIRRTFLESLGGYDERLRRAQDYDLWLRGCRKFRYHNLQEPLIRYRLSPKPTWVSVRYGAQVVLVNALRLRRPAAALWYTARYVAGAALVRAGVAGPPLARPG